MKTSKFVDRALELKKVGRISEKWMQISKVESKIDHIMSYSGV